MYRSCWNALIALLNDTTDKKENEALAIALKISPWWCGTRNFENNSTYSVPRSGYHKPVAKRKEKEGKKKDNAIKIVHSFFFRLFFSLLLLSRMVERRREAGVKFESVFFFWRQRLQRQITTADRNSEVVGRSIPSTGHVTLIVAEEDDGAR